MSDVGSKGGDSGYEQQLRDMNEALLVSSVRQHELAEEAEQAQHKAEHAVEKAEHALEQSEHDRKALQISEEQFRRMVHEAPVPVIMHAEDGEVLQISRAWTELTGYSIEDKEVIQSWLTKAYGFGGDKVRDAMQHAFLPPDNGEGPLSAKLFEIVTRMGDHRTWTFSASTPGVLSDGRRFVVGTAADITERMRADEQLRENQTRLAESQMSLAIELAATQQLQEVSIELFREDDPEALYEKIVDAAVMIMRSQYASVQMFHPERGAGELRLLAYRGFNRKATKFWEWVQPGSKSTCGIALKRGKRVIVPNVEACDWMADSEDLAVYLQTGIRAVQSSPLLSRSGRVLGMISTHWSHPHRPTKRDLRLLDLLSRQAADLIERSNAEQALRQSEERLRLLIESATDFAIFTMTLEGRIDRWNTGAEKVFGWTEEEIVGKSGEIVFTPEDRKAGAVEQELATALKHGRAADERWHIRKDGSRFYASGVMTSIRDEAGEVRGFAKIARDMTAKLSADEAIRSSETLRVIVESQEAERKRIARDLHDQLGQQLTGLRLKLESLKSKHGSEREMMKAIDETQRQAQTLDADITFLVWQLRPTALDNLGLRNALGRYVVEWSKNYDIVAEFHSARARKGRLLPAIEINLYRIAQEALNNVLKHAKATKVDVMLEYGRKDVVLVVEDNGSGFDPNGKPRRKKKGNGFGLVGMRERAALVGGSLEIESTARKGTTIIARVPATLIPNGESGQDV